MAYRIVSEYRNKYNIKVVFANTGQENEETLQFVEKCDRAFNLSVVWVEAKVHSGRKGTTHKVVDFYTASREGVPFLDVCEKFGLPNQKWPICTRELKLRPIESYIKNFLGWKKSEYLTAIGIRTDESRRVSKNSGVNNIVYPLIDWFPTDKSEVNDFWNDQLFSLNLKEHQGNCKWCWKKSFSKHARLIKESPLIYEFPSKLEKLYSNVGPEPESLKPRKMFRGLRNVSQLFSYCNEIKPWEEHHNVLPDENSGCTESCELYETEIIS